MLPAIRWLGVSLSVLTAAAAPAADAAPLRIAGSTTLFPVAEGWAAGFRERFPEAPVELSAGGTTAGIAALLEGSADLALASRPLRAAEEARAAELGLELERIEVARDALAVVVHRDNPVAELSAEQLRGVFTGELKRWDAVGGPPRPIRVVARNPESHTGQFLGRRILEGRAFSPDRDQVSTRAEMIARGAAEPWAIGFAGLADALNSQEREQVKLLRLVLDDADPAARVRGDSAYAISRPLFFFARGPLAPAVAEFVRFVLGPEGQALIVASNFFPLGGVADPAPP